MLEASPKATVPVLVKTNAKVLKKSGYNFGQFEHHAIWQSLDEQGHGIAGKFILDLKKMMSVSKQAWIVNIIRLIVTPTIASSHVCA